MDHPCFTMLPVHQALCGLIGVRVDFHWKWVCGSEL